MKKIILLYLLCMIHASCATHEITIPTHQSTSENHQTKQQITLAKIRTYLIKNPEKNLMITMMLSFLSHHWIKNSYDITIGRIPDPIDNNFDMDLKLSHVAPSIFFFSKLFYDSYRTKKYIARQNALIAKLKK